MMISGNRRIPLWYGSQQQKQQIFFKYVPAYHRAVRIGCICPPPPSPDVIGVGSGDNTLMYSRDGGMSWTGLGTSIFSTTGLCAAWNGSMWVAGGQGTNVLAYSYDGISWTGIPDVSTGPDSTMIIVNSVSYRNGVWIGTNGSNDLVLSSDGINWTGYSGITSSRYAYYLSSNGSQVNGIPSYGNELVMSYTSDGINWTAVSDPNITAEGFQRYSDIVYDGSKYIIVIGERETPVNSKFYSYDGINWTGSPVVNYVDGTNIGCMGSSLYISRGSNPDATEKSTDGINWSTVSNSIVTSFPVVQGIKGTIFGTDSNIIICGYNNNSYIYSPDGNNWYSKTTGLSGNFKAAFFKKIPL
jgi:hypothetical protein